VFGGIWNEDYTNPTVSRLLSGTGQEMDWWGGVSIGFAEHFLSHQHLEFVFPWGGTIRTMVFKLTLTTAIGSAITIIHTLLSRRRRWPPPILGKTARHR